MVTRPGRRTRRIAACEIHRPDVVRLGTAGLYCGHSNLGSSQSKGQVIRVVNESSEMAREAHEPNRLGGALVLLLLVVASGWVGWRAWQDMQPSPKKERGGKDQPVAVEVAEVRRGPIALTRNFTGTLEPRAQFVVAAKVAGRVQQIEVQLADRVEQGQQIALLDDAEFVQEVRRAEAELAVARANLARADSDLEVAQRELRRVQELKGRGVSSESQYDTAVGGELSARAQREVARAEVQRAVAELETARIRLGYTRVEARWSGGQSRRIVAERHVDEGETVAAQAPLLTIVELDPILAVIHVTEAEYARLTPGTLATLTTDAWPGREFAAQVARIAPVFERNSRQARVELEVKNPDQALKPGMFVRVRMELERHELALQVPLVAVARREDRDGVFLLDETVSQVRWQAVKLGVIDQGWVEVLDGDFAGLVVTLGQQLLKTGSAVVIPSPLEAQVDSSSDREN